MPRNLTVEDIIASGVEGRAWRVLTCSLAWPAGEPPFVEGERVSVPAIPATPPAYDAATFDADIWTDCTRLVQDFRFNQEGNMPCDQLSLAVPAAWGAALAPAFAEMRVVVVQTRHRGSELDTGWTNLCWCLSDGYQESWDGNAHHYVVNAKSVLKLANLEILGARSGRAVYQADLVQVGAFTNRATMTLVATAADAYEYGVVDANGAVHPNWSDRPAPQFWCTNARRADGTLETEPVPLATGGEAVQAVFGEGVVRVGTTWAHTSSAKNGATDYGQGLGISEGTDPVIVGLLWRFAHPAMDDRDDTPVASDVADGLTVIASSAGSVQLSAAVRSTGLTLVLRDGTGRRYATMATDTTTDALTLTNSSITAPVDTAVSYGDANRAADVLQRMLLDCGFQQLDD
ncbi:MAG TPA: hypothetical protein PLZ36_16535, partial [Armatimonadota bacterium]|nr:hypothetical protein [Armatimonadota bacterium]